MKVKSLKEIRMGNCGINALSQICELKNLSAFSLIHMGRDNGIELSVFKVNNLADLPRVQRPAIFHQKDHFVYVKNGEPMPDGDYTGYVIGSVVMGRVISLSDAKSIKGGKNFLTGKNKDGEQTGKGAIGDILAVVATVVTGNPAIGAAVYAGYGAVERAQNQDVLGSPGNLGAIGSDLLRGYAEGAGATGAVQGFSAGGGLSAGIPQSAFNAAKGAIQGETQAFAHPIQTSLHGLNIAPAASLAGQTAAFGGGVSNAFNAAGGANAISGSGTGAAGLAGQFSNAVSSAVGAGSAAGVNPIFQSTASSFKPAAGFSLTPFNLSSGSSGAGTGAATTAASPTGGAAALAGGTTPGGFNPLMVGAGLAGTLGAKAPTVEGSATGNYSAAKQFLGDSEYNKLITPTSNTLLNYINTPISDLQQQFTKNNQRTLDTINTAYDNQKNNLVHQYAQAGQNLSNSSELQDKVGQLEQKRVNDLTLANQELTDQALGQAIQVKQNALSSSLQQGQYDANTAMDLAKLTGDDQALQYAIANNDYQTFQNIMGKILTSGLPNQNTGLGNISLKLA